jgi:hypothetical protein
MTKPNFIFKIAAVFVFCFAGTNVLFAQTEVRQTPPQAEPSFEVLLQILVASNDAGEKSPVPQALSGVVKKLRANYPFSSYNLASTYLQRVANTGILEFKSISSEPNQDAYAPVISDWSLGQLRNVPNSQGANSIQMASFRFGQRVPIKTAGTVNETGKTNYVINYESVGLTMQKLSLPENVPTVVGSLTTSKPNQIMFLVLTVKPAE